MMLFGEKAGAKLRRESRSHYSGIDDRMIASTAGSNCSVDLHATATGVLVMPVGGTFSYVGIIIPKMHKPIAEL